MLPALALGSPIMETVNLQVVINAAAHWIDAAAAIEQARAYDILSGIVTVPIIVAFSVYSLSWGLAQLIKSVD